MDNIKVSIIIPIYNMEKYLEDCLNSVVNQLLEDIEIILIDDGSTDKSGEIIEEFLGKYPDKIIAIKKENGGQGAARNIGIAKSRGEYIGFVDADDYIELDMYKTMYDVAKENDSDYVECDYRFLKVENEKEVELPKYGVVKKRNNIRELFIDPLVSPWNKLYRGSILRDNGIGFPEGVIYEDTSFYLKAIPYIKKYSFVDQVFVKHFQRSNSTMTGSKSEKVADIFPVLEDAISFYKKNDFWHEYNNELEYFAVKILLFSSVERISKIMENDLRHKFVERTWTIIKGNFNQYKKNKYIPKSIKGIYMKLANPFICKLLVGILRIKHTVIK